MLVLRKSMLWPTALLALSSCISAGTPSEGDAAAAPAQTTPAAINSPTGGTSEPGVSNPSANPQGSQAGTSGTTNGSPVGTSTQPAAPQPVTGLARYTLVGRFDTTNPNAIPFTFLSSKVGVLFTGTSIAIDLASTNFDGFNIVLDGNSLAPLMVSPAPTTRYTVAKNLPAGTHTLWLTKRTEFNQSGTNTLTLGNMVLDAGATFLTPPAAKTRRIEVAGDSGFASYGVEGLVITGDASHPQCSYTTSTQNGDLAVPSLVAKALDAEVYNLSWSGKGVVNSQFDSNPAHMVPIVYEQLVGNDPSRLYDFKLPMDVVILSAGGNDFIGTAGQGTLADPTKFVQVYSDWILRIRGRYPNALIVAAIGANAKQNDRTQMQQLLMAAVQKAQAAKAGGDAKVIFFDYFANDPNGWTNYSDVAERGGYNWGCDYHPSVRGAGWLAGRLTPVIKAQMNW